MPQKSIYFGDTFQKAGKKGRQVFRQAPMYRGDQPGPLSNRANTNSPMEFQTQRNYSQTFGGPIQLDENLWRGAQNQGMAQAAFVGNARGYQNQTARQGVRAGNKMQAYSSGTMGNAAAAQAIGDAQRQRLTSAAENASARLGFQERQAGERGWLRDLMLDRDDVNTRTQMADYKREIDRQLAMRQREVDNAISARQREAMIMSSLMRGMGGLLGGLV
jgi:hypothetical protein